MKDHACVSCHDFVIPLVCFNFEQLKKIISLFAALGLTCVTRDLLLCLMDSLVLAHGLHVVLASHVADHGLSGLQAQ